MEKIYYRYLLSLQNEYKKLLEFCLDANFYAKELEEITGASRFTLYRNIADVIPHKPLNISFRFAMSGFGNVSTPIRDKEAYQELIKNPKQAVGAISAREPNDFEKAYGINPIETELVRVLPVPIISSYKCGSLEEMLFLEFEKMLELDIRIKKCKNCGRYFMLKGNYQTEYCNRIPKGESQNCQSIAAAAKYAKKVKKNPALAIFNRAYKRYHARVKVGSVKTDAFKKWQYEAVVMRDKCLKGEISVLQFEEWVDGYFG